MEAPAFSSPPLLFVGQAWIAEIRGSGLAASGNHIKANSRWIAFHTDLAGKMQHSLALLPSVGHVSVGAAL